MRRVAFKTILACLALVAAGAVAAQPKSGPELSAFDASRTNSVAQKLVLCDTTAFLTTRPNLQADRMYARRELQPFQLLLGPYFVQGGLFFSERYDRLFRKMEHEGLVSRAQVSDIQAAQGRPYIDIYDRSSFLPNRFVDAQNRYCEGYARSNGVSGPA